MKNCLRIVASGVYSIQREPVVTARYMADIWFSSIVLIIKMFITSPGDQNGFVQWQNAHDVTSNKKNHRNASIADLFLKRSGNQPRPQSLPTLKALC